MSDDGKIFYLTFSVNVIENENTSGFKKNLITDEDKWQLLRVRRDISNFIACGMYDNQGVIVVTIIIPIS